MLTTTAIKQIAKATFETRSRKFRIVERRTYQMENYWDGGSREYAVAIDLVTGRTVDPCSDSTNPFNRKAHAGFEIPAGVGILCHSIFCGKDCGITMYVAPGKELAAVPSDLRTTIEIPAVTMAQLVGAS